MSLPAGPMISLTSALDGVCTIWKADGTEQQISSAEFVAGDQRNVLAPGDLLASDRYSARRAETALGFPPDFADTGWAAPRRF